MEKIKKILIADDDHSIHELLGLVLHNNKFVIIHAYDGLQAREYIERYQPDLVVLDIMMPCLDGRDLCRELRQNKETENLKILMLSGRTEQVDRRLGLEVGADDYETKPFSPHHLARKIERMCGQA